MVMPSMPVSSPPGRKTPNVNIEPAAHPSGAICSVKPRACSGRYGEGIVVQRWMSGSWQIAYTASVSCGPTVRSSRRSVVSVTGSIG
ncbi:hypothetical protein SHKM778_84600 [Streptomyces sp. KM77-8]|uniref:Uncharacterized protein n=1 Tax=Streptomyces haneummycinicus TaxID=3074435 RepID=A0AAT9HXF7_9ACTN